MNGFKFVRQLPIGPYFADFVCREEKLVIELDGATHGTDAEIRRDRYRSTLVEARGYRIVRFNNVDVVENRESVLESILAALERRSTL